jgi:hypothetical protein
MESISENEDGVNLPHLFVKVLVNRGMSAPKGNNTRKPIEQRSAWSLIVFSNGDRGKGLVDMS